MKAVLVWYLNIVSALVFALATAESLSEKCKNAVDNNNPNLGQLCVIQNEVESILAALERVQNKLDKAVDRTTRPVDRELETVGKRKNEFVRFGRGGENSQQDAAEVEKRKNEFVRFGRGGDNSQLFPQENQDTEVEKRKNEFVRFGRMSADKRKNEFVRFGKKSVTDEFSEEKRKNEFVRFG